MANEDLKVPSSTESTREMMVKSISTIVEADSILNTYESSQYAGSPGQNYTMYETKQTTIMFPSRLNGYYCKERRDHMDHNSWKLTQSFIYLIIPYPEKRKTQGVSLYFALLINVCFDNALADLELCDNGRDIGVNRSLDPFFDDYIELNNLNVPLELRRDQVDDSMPTIEEGEVVKEFRTRNDARMVRKFFGYPSDCDHDKKIHFAVLEDMDAYCDEEMGDVIFGEPFLREVRINAKRFEGMITIHNGNEEVTYQMVSEGDKIDEILHSYQKLKGFYKEILNLGPEYIQMRNGRMAHTRAHKRAMTGMKAEEKNLT
ncbi:hypothetical protein Tco_1282844 [Tanacetum coccineum]